MAWRSIGRATRRPRGARPGPAALVLVLGLGACTLVVTAKDTAQCSNDEECRAKGGAFAGTVCAPAGVCVAGAGTGDCLANVDCAPLGPNYVCRPDKDRRACVSLVSAECSVVDGDVKEGTVPDQAFVFGTILVGADGSTAVENGVRLAAREFKTTANGLPPTPNTAGQRRPLVFVACSDGGNPDTAAAAATHLIKVVGVPAIIGGSNAATTDAVVPLALQNDVLLLSPTSTSVRLTTLTNRKGLVWRTTPSDAYQAEALVPFTDQVSDRFDEDAPPLRVVVANANDEYGTSLRNQLEGKLTFNQQFATAQVGTNYFRADYAPDDQASIGAAAAAVVAQTPHVVFLFGGPESVTGILAGVEAAWPPLTGALKHRPVYLLADAINLPQVPAAIGANDDLRKRVFGTLARSNTNAYRAFQGNLSGAFRNEPFNALSANAYDATYLVAFAATALGGAAITGPALTGPLTRLVPGAGVKRVVAGATGLNVTLNQLQAPGATLDFEGVSGPLNFFVQKGEAFADVQIMCVPKDQGGRAAPAVIGQRFFNASTLQLEPVTSGASACD